jgi:hypothetical protein
LHLPCSLHCRCVCHVLRRPAVHHILPRGDHSLLLPPFPAPRVPGIGLRALRRVGLHVRAVLGCRQMPCRGVLLPARLHG